MKPGDIRRWDGIGGDLHIMILSHPFISDNGYEYIIILDIDDDNIDYWRVPFIEAHTSKCENV